MSSAKQKALESQDKTLIYEKSKNKNFAAFFVGAALVTVVAITVFVSLFSSSKNVSDFSNDLDLKLVHLVCSTRIRN